jgi:WD40 repeat protein
MCLLTGHEGPMCNLTFQKTGDMLACASWDGTMKLWDLYKGNVPSENAQHASHVVCVAFWQDGKEICMGTIGGLLSFWNTEDAKLKYEIDGRRDIGWRWVSLFVRLIYSNLFLIVTHFFLITGRKLNDWMTSDNIASSETLLLNAIQEMVLVY